MSNFAQWLDTFVAEKGLDTEHVFEVKTDDFWGTHFIPLGVVIEAAKGASRKEQALIKDIVVKIDFRNGDVLGFFRVLAEKLAGK